MATTLNTDQLLALINAWPSGFEDAPGVRICRDLNCPGCGYPEMGQTINSDPLPTALYCRRCGYGECNIKPPTMRPKHLDLLTALAWVAIRAWNPDNSPAIREASKPAARLAARVANTAKLLPQFKAAVVECGPHGSKAAVARLIREALQ